MKSRKPLPPPPPELPLDRAPSRQETLTRLRHLIDNGDICLAYRIISRLMDAEPGCADWLDVLGTIYLRAGATESARAMIRQALQIDPSHPEAQFHLAQVFAAEGNILQACQQLQAAIDLQPDCSRYREWMAELNALLSPSRRDSQETNRDGF